jgi:hypothetical protein
MLVSRKSGLLYVSTKGKLDGIGAWLEHLSGRHLAQEGVSRRTARTAELLFYITTIVLSLQPHEQVTALNFCSWSF